MEYCFRKTSISALWITPMPLCRSQQTVENSLRDGNIRPPYLPPENPICRLRSNRTGSKLGKEYIKAVYCHPAYLSYMQSTSLQILDETQAGIKIAGRNINNLRYTDDTTLMQKARRNYNF